MHRRLALASLVIVFLGSATLVAQDKKTKQAEKKLSTILKEFDDDLRAYDKELKHFQRVPIARPLMDTRKELVDQAIKMSELEKAGRGSGPAIRTLAKEMKATAVNLDKGTLKLENHAKTVAGKADRAAATQMRKNADSMIAAIDKMIDMFR